jgi:hypothetical protein
MMEGKMFLKRKFPVLPVAPVVGRSPPTPVESNSQSADESVK